MNNHALDGNHTLAADGTAQMFVALMGEELLLQVECAITVVAENAVEGAGGRALLLPAHWCGVFGKDGEPRVIAPGYGICGKD